MGKCGACFSAGTRVLLYLALLVGSAATLWGMVGSQEKNSTCWLGGSTCLLFGSVASNTTRCGVPNLHLPTGGSAVHCQYVIYFAVAQLIALGALLTLTAVVACFRKDGQSDATWRRIARFVELLAVVGLVLCSLGCAVLLSIGVGVFCGNLEKHWRAEPSNLVHGNATVIRSSSCSSLYVARDVSVAFNATGNARHTSTFHRVKFFRYFAVAQIAMWASFLVWAFHLVISVVAYRRKHGSDENLPYTLHPSDSLSSLDEDLLT